ncbi:MAG: 3-oxoacyl-ACP reductase [Ectothiorhodospiraceae bacterium]|nr:3-oxoacyl-ACP reductase [Ectothiorhodospiraceae bacterium]
MTRKDPKQWALILGASSGFGAATARHLAHNGYNILGIHLDRKATMGAVEELIEDIKSTGHSAIFHNINAADPVKRHEALDDFVDNVHREGRPEIRVLFHSLAFGTLKPLVGRSSEEMITKQQLEMTLDVMANSLIYWTQDCVRRHLLGRGARIFAMTSDGASLNLPFYGAVSAAKAALESYIRQLALELGPRGIIANALLAGVTDTPALNKIPGARNMLIAAIAKNPLSRATHPEDVAKAVLTLVDSGADFINGNIIGVDGGESKVSYIGQQNPYQYSDLRLLAESSWDPTDVS